MSVLLLFLSREWSDMRRNSRVLPLLLVMPLIAVGVPVLVALFAPTMAREALLRQDPATATLLRALTRLPEFAGLTPGEGLARYLLRAAAGMFLLLPIAIASTAAAFSIVGEKQQRTLEPILATPISDRQLLLGKLLASTVPTVAMTWLAGVAAILIVDGVFAARGQAAPLPDRFWTILLLVLVPALTAAVALVTMRLSARSTDPQSTVQIASLAILPAFLLIAAVFGRLLTFYFPALLAAGAAVLLLDVALFRMNVARFRREEILTQWK